MAERELNDAQREAVEHGTGPALTLAGPGSGKTTVLTERTLNLVRKTRMPEQILSVTFTNAAGEEMRNRYEAAARIHFPELRNSGEPRFQTVHSFCNGLIREYEKITSIRYHRIEGVSGGKTEILRKIYYEINLEEADPYLIHQIGNRSENSSEPEIKNIKRIKAAYEQYKRQQNLLDFDDMMDGTAVILHSDGFVQKRIREQYQEHFRFIQVDEAQDLTQIQFDILQIIAASRNIFVVADDDQSIYGFRGASPSCVSSFYRNQNDCKLYHLSKNYRSVQNIVRTSEQFISKNTERFDKNLYSEKECGRMPQIKECRNSLLQAEFVVKELRKLQRRNPYLETGILYRNNISGLLISAVFAKENMSYYHQGDLPESSEIVFLESVLQKIRDRERSERHILPQPIQTFRNLLEEGLEREFELYCRDTRQHMRYKDAVLPFFFYLCSVCASWQEAVRLLDQIDAARKANAQCNICLSTVHSAKGLEYDAVFIIDAVMGEFPGSGASSGKLLEEERRLFYVALTRARNHLYVTYPLHRGNLYENKKTEQESVFVTEFKQCLRAARNTGFT